MEASQFGNPETDLRDRRNNRMSLKVKLEIMAKNERSESLVSQYSAGRMNSAELTDLPSTSSKVGMRIKILFFVILVSLPGNVYVLYCHQNPILENPANLTNAETLDNLKQENAVEKEKSD